MNWHNQKFVDLSLANASPNVSVSEAQAGIPSEGGRGSMLQKASVTIFFFQMCNYKDWVACFVH